MQYGLFLKGIGLSLEESLKYWRTEFTKMMDLDKFEKQYTYNIRYNYGKEGKRKDRTPYNCMRLIMNDPPAGGDHHGCPFRYTPPDLLAQRLKGLKISNFQINGIIDKVRPSVSRMIEISFVRHCSVNFMLHYLG